METARFGPPPPLPNFRPERLDTSALESSITTLAANIAAATWQWLMLIAEFDRREGWAGAGIVSCAHWLNWKCGIALGAAREKVRVAHALAALPKTSAAFAAGEISFSKVRAMTRVATPANEDFLLMIARHGMAAHVERAMQGYRRVLRIEETTAARRAHAARALSWHYDDDGMLVIHARVSGEVGAVILKALAAAGEDLAADVADCAADHGKTPIPPAFPQQPPSIGEGEAADVPAGTSAADDPVKARRADALCHLAEQFLAHGPIAMKQADRHQIVIHVERESLTVDGGGSRCELEHGPALAAATARRLACDASLVEIEEDNDGNPLDIGHKTRAVPPALRRALQSRDGGCRFPGCTHQRYVDAHHIRHWADGGATSIRNLLLLCRHHHRLVHEGGFTVEQRDDGKALFLRPDGMPIPEVPPPQSATQALAEYVCASGVDISAGTCVTKWAGERMDLDLVVLGLLQSDKRLRA